MILAGGDGDGATPELDVAGAGGGLVVPDVVGVAVAQLPVGAGAPAADVAGAQQGAGVVAAGGDGGGLGAEGDVSGGGGGLVVPDAVPVAVAELTGGAAAAQQRTSPVVSSAQV
ncbi:MAG: hypothetical protein R2709_04440 [Marmoricola sp.]